MAKAFHFGGQKRMPPSKNRPDAYDRNHPNSKSCMPANTTKIQRAEGVGGWGYHPLRNNVSMLQCGVNANDQAMANKTSFARKKDTRKKNKGGDLKMRVINSPTPMYVKPEKAPTRYAPVVSVPEVKSTWGDYTDSTLNRFKNAWR